LTRLLAALLFAPLLGAAQEAPPNSLLLVARPGLADPNFRETVVLVTQAPDASTVGVILNRPTPAKHEATGAPLYEGGPVMRPVVAALFTSDTPPEAPAFRVLPGVYLSIHPQNVEKLAPRSARHRLFAGFSGWAPGQLQSEIERDGWHLLPASEALLFRAETGTMWRELLEAARRKKTRVYSFQ
jgi:putative transcriptional regulator